MTSLTLANLKNDPVEFDCARDGCQRFSVPMKALVDQFGLDAQIPDIASRLSCRDPDAFGNDPCFLRYVELMTAR